MKCTSGRSRFLLDSYHTSKAAVHKAIQHRPTLCCKKYIFYNYICLSVCLLVFNEVNKKSDMYCGPFSRALAEGSDLLPTTLQERHQILVPCSNVFPTPPPIYKPTEKGKRSIPKIYNDKSPISLSLSKGRFTPCDFVACNFLTTRKKLQSWDFKTCFKTFRVVCVPRRASCGSCVKAWSPGLNLEFAIITRRNFV